MSPQLFVINPNGTTTEIKLTKDVLKSKKCYILVADDIKKIYLWKGLKSSVGSKFYGEKRSQEVWQQVGMHYAVVPLDEGDEDAEFKKVVNEPTITKERRKKQEFIAKINQMLRVSTRIELEMMQTALDIDKKTFSNKIFQWAEDFGFTIDGSYLIVNKDTIDDFMATLDKQYEQWAEKEDNNLSKLN